MIRIVLFTTLLLSSVFSHAEKLNVSTTRGDVLEVFQHVPDATSKKYPALIIAPGQGYHMDLPVIKKLAEAAANKGIMVFRFNWHYFTHQGEASGDLVKESQDLAAVIQYAKNHAQIDSKKIMIAGKSLGSIVGYSEFIKRADLHSLYMLTPVCTWQWDKQDKEITPYSVWAEKYPDLKLETRPVHITLGSKDNLCTKTMLNEFMLSTKSNITSTMFAGNHGLNLGDWRNPKFKNVNSANVQAAVNATVHWMTVHLNLDYNL